VVVPAAATEAAQLPDTIAAQAAQAALDNTTTTADLSWAAILGQIPCRDPREISYNSIDEWQFVDGVQCGPPTPVEAREQFTYDLGAAAVAIAATPGFPGDDLLFVINLGKSAVIVVGVTASSWLVGQGLVALHTNKEHDPYYPGGEAEAITEDVTANWPGGPDGKDWLCYTIRLAGKIVREVFWRRAGTPAYMAAYGDLAWFDYETGLWGGAYPYKVSETVGNLPKDLKNLGYRIESGCGNPPPFTPAH
jgi:hypothetical protein